MVEQAWTTYRDSFSTTTGKKQGKKVKRENSRCWQECGRIRAPVHSYWGCKMVQPLFMMVVLQKLKNGITI
jgi:hypothetical protein